MLAIVNALLRLFVTVLLWDFAAWHHDVDSALAKALNGMVMTYALPSRWRAALVNAGRAAGLPTAAVLSSLWASMCLALHVAFWLELDIAYWAGDSAGPMCQPHLGASLPTGERDDVMSLGRYSGNTAPAPLASYVMSKEE